MLTYIALYSVIAIPSFHLLHSSVASTSWSARRLKKILPRNNSGQLSSGDFARLVRAIDLRVCTKKLIGGSTSLQRNKHVKIFINYRQI